MQQPGGDGLLDLLLELQVDRDTGARGEYAAAAMTVLIQRYEAAAQSTLNGTDEAGVT